MPHDSAIPVPKSKPIRVKYASEIPSCKHWAIVEDATVMESGYDPGDSPSSTPIVNYTAYLDQEQWEEEIRQRSLSRSPSAKGFKALVVDVPVITTTVKVEIK